MFSNFSPQQPLVPQSSPQAHTEPPSPSRERDSITGVLATPGITLGTYDDPKKSRQSESPNQGYFHSQTEPSSQETGQPSSDSSPSDTSSRLDTIGTQRPNGTVALGRTVLSATCTVPHLLRYRKGATWEMGYQQHRSAHLDSLSYLSSGQSPWNHIVIAWTGEIAHISGEAFSSPDVLPAITPSSTSISPGAHAQNEEELATDEILITYADKTMLEEQLYNDHIRTVPIWLADSCDITEEGIKLKRQSRWRRYAEHDLCALFHYRQHPPTDGRKEDIRWNDYHRMNEAFADKICDIYKPGDIVIVHDYYLMLLPQMLRQRRPDIYVLFFLGSPFPTSELVRCLHSRDEILKGVLGSSLIGFQSFHYAQHFANSCTRLLDYPASSEWVDAPGARVHIGVLPTGIDVSKITSLAHTDSVRKKCAELGKLYKGKKIIIGSDPLDRLGGVDKKLQAFGCFLDRYPQWREKVVLVQTTSPPTIEDDDGDGSRYARKVSEMANSLNRTYGSLGFTPVQLYSQQLPQDEYFALLRLGDVALNTCVREGMSTMSLEYIVCQQDTYGTLIISEFSGTASNLEEAIQINPWNATEVAGQINNALIMTTERRRQVHKALFTRVTEGSTEFWVNSVLQRLAEVLTLRV